MNEYKLMFLPSLLDKAVLKKSELVTPFISIGFCIARKIPNLALSSVVSLSMLFPLYNISPFKTV